MGKHDKTMERLRRTPPPSDLKWSDLKGLLVSLGYEVINGAGSRRKFFHRELKLLICCHEPHPEPNVDKGCIVDIVSHLKENGFIQE